MPMTATPGEILGSFEVIAPLAVGGMARLFLARTSGVGQFERHIVLKLMNASMAHDEHGVAMFLEEARVLSALNHQNIANVLGVGQDQERYFVALEYVHGRDVREILDSVDRAGAVLPVEFGVAITARAANGLAHAHSRHDKLGQPLGIVHRDVTPSNIMVGYDGAVKVIDFGIAKSSARSFETQAGTIKGKFGYMSPEQCRGEDVDQRSDIFALGILLYELTTQRGCFRATSDFDAMKRITTGTYTAPGDIVPGYPPALAAIIATALEVDPALRYPSAGDLLNDLEAVARDAGWSLTTSSVANTMRVLFGDVTEPWNVEPADAASVAAEATGSATGRFGNSPTTAPQLPRRPRPKVDDPVDAAIEDDDNVTHVAALALPRDDAPASPPIPAPTPGPNRVAPRGRPTLPQLVLFGMPSSDESGARRTSGLMPAVRFSRVSTAPPMMSPPRALRTTTLVPSTPIADRPGAGATMLATPPSRTSAWIVGVVAGLAVAITIAVVVVVLMRG